MWRRGTLISSSDKIIWLKDIYHIIKFSDLQGFIICTNPGFGIQSNKDSLFLFTVRELRMLAACNLNI